MLLPAKLRKGGRRAFSPVTPAILIALSRHCQAVLRFIKPIYGTDSCRNELQTQNLVIPPGGPPFAGSISLERRTNITGRQGTQHCDGLFEGASKLRLGGRFLGITNPGKGRDYAASSS